MKKRKKQNENPPQKTQRENRSKNTTDCCGTMRETFLAGEGQQDKGKD
jgi:hypothetical protein